MKKELEIDLVSDSSCKKACLHIAMSQVEDVEAELRLPHVRYSQSRGNVEFTHVANFPSNVRWRRLQTDGRLLDTLTEHSSVWSMSPLSSPCRMETGPGFSPWGLAMPHCGTSCLVLNFPINSFNKHLFAQAGRCRERCHAARSQIGRCSQLLTQEKETPDEVANDSCTHLLFRLISFQMTVAKKLPCESQ